MEEDLKFISFIDISEDEIEMILKWRNSEGIRKEMTNDSLITWDSHISFIKNLKHDVTRDYYLIRSNDYLGVINLLYIDDTSAELGLYRNPEMIGKGIGSVLISAIERIALSKGIKRLLLRVKKQNAIAIKLYEKNQYRQVKFDSDFFYMEKEL